jgi:hypothetical protein
MSIKKFLVQIEDAPSTTWLYPDCHLAETIQTSVSRAVSVYTGGPVPRVTVVREKTPAQSLLKSPCRWRCKKCGGAWACRGMHPDCDGEAADMVEIHP